MLGKFPDLFLGEVAGQPDALRRAASALTSSIQARALQSLHRPGVGGSVLFTGMGGSYDACHAPVTVLAGLGFAAEMVDAAELLHYRRARIRSIDTVLGVSQSGESAETVRLFSALREVAERPRLVAVTNGSANSLSGLADIALDTHAGREEGPSTMTFAASLVTLAALVKALSKSWDEQDAARLVGDVDAAARAVEAALGEPQATAKRLRDWLGHRSTLVIVGRGTARAAAEMGALTLKETARFPAEALQSAQFRHGPLELAGPETAVLVIATEEATVELDARLVDDLRRAGAAVLFVGGEASGLNGTERIAIGALNRLLAPAVAVVPCQLLAWSLAVERGLQPGSMQHATKVTTIE